MEMTALDLPSPSNRRKSEKYCSRSLKVILSLFHNVEKWPKILLKILRCEHRNIFKVCLAIFQHYEIKG